MNVNFRKTTTMNDGRIGERYRANYPHAIVKNLKNQGTEITDYFIGIFGYYNVSYDRDYIEILKPDTMAWNDFIDFVKSAKSDFEKSLKNSLTD